MNEAQRKKCHSIIHSASLAAAGAGAGLAQIPASDSVYISTVQLCMTISIASVFGVKLSQSAATATLATSSATLIGRNAAAFFCSFIPIFGNITNAMTGAAVTELIGWAVANSFDK